MLQTSPRFKRFIKDLKAALSAYFAPKPRRMLSTKFKVNELLFVSDFDQYDQVSYEKMLLDYSLYRDVHGLQQPDLQHDQNRTSDNGIRFTAQYVMAMVNKGRILFGEKSRLKGVVRRCLVEPGLLKRSPQHINNQDSIDNYVGLGLLAYYLDPGYAKDVLAYGRWRLRVYNNAGKRGWMDASSWLFRFPQLFAHMKYACGKTPGPIEYLAWLISIWMARNTRDQDSRVLSWMLAVVGARKTRLGDWVIQKFMDGFQAQYPGGIGEVLENYYNNPAHPDAKYLLKVFGPK